jgi:proteasome lid subunit RPN8/RPN11
MKTMKSPEFRKSYAKLAEPVVVTVHGHPIGTWAPYSAEIRQQYVVDTDILVKPQPKAKETV